MQRSNTPSPHSNIDEPSSSEDSDAQVAEEHCLRVGETFNCFEDFESRLHQFQDASFSCYYKRDSVTITQCRNRGVKRHIAEKLKYYSLSYCCIHGGKKFKSAASGQRSSSTFQKQCEASFRLQVTSDGNALFVSQVNLDHNHQCSKNLYQHLPQARRLKPEDRKQVANLLSLGANRKKVQKQMQDKTNNIILLKDLSNMVAQPRTKNDLATTGKLLEHKHGAECKIYEEDNVFKGLFFVTSDMISAMKSFPEFIGIDATFKLLDIRAPVYLIIVEDSEGCTEIIAVCILVTEDKPSMIWFLECFKIVHTSWNNIKCVMADKDLLERDVIRSSFPSAKVLICVFHTLRTFNREITCDKLGITPGQKTTAKEIFQKMLYAESDDEYNKLYERLRELPRSILQYFNDNWHSIRHEWTLTPDYMRDNFLNITNNRIESLNAKIKSVVKRFSSLEAFVEDFFILVDSLKTERDHKAATAYQKTSVNQFKDNSPEHFYLELLTGHSFQFVQLELRKRSNIRIVGDRSEENFLIQTHGRSLCVSAFACECTPHISMKLPCRHMFAVRDHLQMTLKDQSLYNERWTREYYYQNQRIFSPNEPSEIVPHTVTSTVTTRRILSQHEKYRKAALLTKDIAELASEATGRVYVQRLEVLAKIKTAWAKNREICVTTCGVEEATSQTIPSMAECVLSAPASSNFNPCEASTSTAPNQNVEDINDQISSSKAILKPVDSSDSDDDSNFTGRQTGKDLTKIIVPPALKRKGRPKGAEKTIIGLPKRKVVNVAGTKKQPFCRMRGPEKIIMMLEWFVDRQIAEAAALQHTIIEESAVETRPNHVSSVILDEDVNIPMIKPYFTADAWMLIKQVYKIKNKNKKWECGSCSMDLDTTVGDENTSPNKSQPDMKVTIRCDYCLIWYHLPCVALKSAPKTKYWMCQKCRI